MKMRSPGLYSSPVHVKFVVDKVALGQGFLQVLWVSPVSVIPPMIHTHYHLNVVLPRTKRVKSGNLPKINALPAIGSIG